MSDTALTLRPPTTLSGTAQSLQQKLDGLHGTFLRTNRELYEVLGDALSMARAVETDPDLCTELDCACDAASLRFHVDTTVLNRVLRYIIRDQRLANSYAGALRHVPARCDTPKSIAEFLEEEGIQRLRTKINVENRDNCAQPVDAPSTVRRSHEIALHRLLAGEPDARKVSEEIIDADFSVIDDTELVATALLVDQPARLIAPSSEGHQQIGLSAKVIAKADLMKVLAGLTNFVVVGDGQADSVECIDDPALVAEIRNLIKARSVVDNKPDAVSELLGSLLQDGDQR